MCTHLISFISNKSPQDRHYILHFSIKKVSLMIFLATIEKLEYLCCKYFESQDKPKAG